MKGLIDLTQKVVLVTGGNSGIGLGFAEGCAHVGADIVIWGRRAEKNAEAAGYLRSLGAGQVFCETVDVSDEQQVIDGFSRSVEQAGRIDCVFVNAGISTMASSFPDMTTKMYDDLITINQHGSFYTLREATRHMRARFHKGDRTGGSLVICGSLTVFSGIQGNEHYAAAKGALASMLKGIAVEMGQYNVRANMIAFGFFESAITQTDQALAIAKQIVERTPMRRAGRLQDIHGLATYLCSDLSSFHTGDIITLDGGRRANSP